MLENASALPGTQAHTWGVTGAARPKWTDAETALQMESSLGFQVV